MKRILIFSDTHGDIDMCIRLIKAEQHDLSAVIHAGDNAGDAEDLISIFPDIKIFYVHGNNDPYTRATAEVTAEIGGKRIFITHGHAYRVKYEFDYRTLVEKGKSVNADLTVFGHTHLPYTAYEGKMTVLNPGSLRFSRTYAIAEIDGEILKTKILEY